MRKNNIHISRFVKFIIIYGAILISLVVLGLVLLYGLLKDYESSMPNNTMDTIVGMFSDDNIDNLLRDNEVTTNEFESVDVIAQYIRDEIDEDKITYKRKNGEFTNNTPVYVIIAGDKAIAKVTLTEKCKNAHKFTEWQLGTISFDGYIDANNEVTITAPSNAVVSINGITVSDSYVTDSAIAFEPVKNVGEFVSKPTQVRYKIDGLIAAPNITATLDGAELNITHASNKYVIGYPDGTEIMESQRSIITQINQEYGKYIINRGSLKSLKSNLVGNASTYVSDIPAVWAFLYGKEYTYEFKNESVSNAVKYSDDCFSCDIYYDLYVKWSNGDKTYNTSMTYTFVKIKDKWKLADFMIK